MYKGVKVNFKLGGYSSMVERLFVVQQFPVRIRVTTLEAYARHKYDTSKILVLRTNLKPE